MRLDHTFSALAAEKETGHSHSPCTDIVHAWTQKAIRLSRPRRNAREIDFNVFPTVRRAGATPVPIPNTEVKARFGDGTAGVPRWESSATVGPLERTAPSSWLDAAELGPTALLLSHRVAPAVPSPMWGLTSVFGMGTGVAPTPWTVGKTRRARSKTERRKMSAWLAVAHESGGRRNPTAFDRQIAF